MIPLYCELYWDPTIAPVLYCDLTVACLFCTVGCTAGSYRSLPVLYCELYSDLEPLPLPGGLGNILSHLLGGQAQGTNLGIKAENTKIRI